MGCIFCILYSPTLLILYNSPLKLSKPVVGGQWEGDDRVRVGAPQLRLLPDAPQQGHLVEALLNPADALENRLYFEYPAKMEHSRVVTVSPVGPECTSWPGPRTRPTRCLRSLRSCGRREGGRRGDWTRRCG